MRAQGRSVETELRCAVKRQFRGGVQLEGDGTLPEFPDTPAAAGMLRPSRRQRAGSVVLDALALVLGLALGLAGLHALRGDSAEGCRACVVMTR